MFTVSIDAVILYLQNHCIAAMRIACSCLRYTNYPKLPAIEHQSLASTGDASMQNVSTYASVDITLGMTMSLYACAGVASVNQAQEPVVPIGLTSVITASLYLQNSTP